MTDVPQRWSAAIEDYLRAIHAIGERTTAEVTVTALAARLGVSASSASGMVRKLADRGLVTHLAYQGIDLTPAGRLAALWVVRRHRLLELFLVQELGFGWDEVHAEADALEHTVSDTLVERLAAKLGDPTRDPHGDPIPTHDGRTPPTGEPGLTELAAGASGEIVRVRDASPEILRYLSSCGVGLGTQVELLERHPFGGSTVVRVGHGPSAVVHAFGQELAAALVIRVDQ